MAGILGTTGDFDTRGGITRRSALKAAAWAAPSIVFTVTAPAATASTTPPPPADYGLILDAYETGFSIDVKVTPLSGFPTGGHVAFRVPQSRFTLWPVDYLSSPWRNYSSGMSNVHVVWAKRDVTTSDVLRIVFPDNVGDFTGATYEIWSAEQQLVMAGALSTN